MIDKKNLIGWIGILTIVPMALAINSLIKNSTFLYYTEFNNLWNFKYSLAIIATLFLHYFARGCFQYSKNEFLQSTFHSICTLYLLASCFIFYRLSFLQYYQCLNINNYSAIIFVLIFSFFLGTNSIKILNTRYLKYPACLCALGFLISIYLIIYKYCTIGYLVSIHLLGEIGIITLTGLAAYYLFNKDSE